jgi:uncharacterized protein YbjT (DUF2867 family)
LPRQSHETSTCILVIGSSGYIGSKLVPRFLKQGYRVRCLVRDRNRVAMYAWSGSVEVMEGDVLDAASLNPAFQRASVVYYLVHSMSNPRYILENRKI